jgi:glutamate-1-semialdehyde 2,1-aminomutase
MTDELSKRASELAAEETKKLIDATPASGALYERAIRTLPLGVASSFQAGDPYPIYVDHGSGSQIWDVDGQQRIDYHNGFGCMVVGHAHPKVVEAIDRAAR